MRLWMIIVPAFALGGLNAAYDVWKASPPSAQTELRRKCIALAGDAGIARGVAVEGCNCTVNKARGWSNANPGAEYTIDVHRRLAVGCFTSAQAKSDNVLSQPGVFSNSTPQRKPAVEAGSGWPGAPPPRPATGSPYQSLQGSPPAQPEDLGWGDK